MPRQGNGAAQQSTLIIATSTVRVTRATKRPAGCRFAENASRQPAALAAQSSVVTRRLGRLRPWGNAWVTAVRLGAPLLSRRDRGRPSVTTWFSGFETTRYFDRVNVRKAAFRAATAQGVRAINPDDATQHHPTSRRQL